MNFRNAGSVSTETKGGAAGGNLELVFSGPNCDVPVQQVPNKQTPKLCV